METSDSDASSNSESEEETEEQKDPEDNQLEFPDEHPIPHTPGHSSDQIPDIATHSKDTEIHASQENDHANNTEEFQIRLMKLRKEMMDEFTDKLLQHEKKMQINMDNMFNNISAQLKLQKTPKISKAGHPNQNNTNIILNAINDQFEELKRTLQK